MGFTITPTAVGTKTVPVSDEVKQNMADAWTAQQENVAAVWAVTFDSDAERDKIKEEMRSWATGEGLTFRVVKGSETGEDAETGERAGFAFRISRPLTDDEKAEAKAERERKRREREAAGKAAPGRKAKGA